MCTVTYLPLENGFMLTSSRDEVKTRITEPPKKYLVGNEMLLFPKDSTAGGSWIAVSERNKVRCLLNGAFENFESKPEYTQSRGQILLNSFRADDIEDYVNDIDCVHTAPFTLLMIDYADETDFYKFVWDGENKYLEKQDSNTSTIWSSSTLYDESARNLRAEWFEKWLNSAAEKGQILDFHNRRHGDDPELDILMERQNGIKTVSISSVRMQKNFIEFHYFDIINNRNYVSKF